MKGKGRRAQTASERVDPLTPAIPGLSLCLEVARVTKVPSRRGPVPCPSVGDQIPLEVPNPIKKQESNFHKDFMCPRTTSVKARRG